MTKLFCKEIGSQEIGPDISVIHSNLNFQQQLLKHQAAFQIFQQDFAPCLKRNSVTRTKICTTLV